jgi:hypothetical protein
MSRSAIGHPADRPFFFKALQGYTDAAARPVSHFIQSVILQQKTVIFIGDSLMLQNVQFFICQARREKLVVIEDHADSNCYWRFNISPLQLHNNTSSTSVQVHFHRIGTLSSYSMCPTAKKGRYKLYNESYALGSWKDVKRLTEVLIKVLTSVCHIVASLLYSCM